MPEGNRKRRRLGPVIDIARGDELEDSSSHSEPHNRDITLSRQGRRLAHHSTLIAAGPSDQQLVGTPEPTPWSPDFFDEVHEDPVPVIEDKEDSAVCI
jgi:hypothetical protein